MSLYDRILQEAQREGIEHRPPPQSSSSREEPTGELRMLRMWTYHPPTNAWQAMAFGSLQHKHTSEYERLLLRKNGGKWMFPFREKERR
jgi:hypothetical protein